MAAGWVEVRTSSTTYVGPHGGVWSLKKVVIGDFTGLPVTSKRQWGGYAEIVVLARILSVRAWVFMELPGGMAQLCCEPIGDERHRPISLLWCGSCQYDALRLPEEQLTEALSLE
jgi:hypothetical protein